MLYRFASLGSGSRGNATLIEAGGTVLLVDCGFGLREFIARCDRLGFDHARVGAILVTHEHGDHMRGVGALARRLGIPVWMSHGTCHAGDFGRVEGLRLFAGHAGPFAIGDLQVTPVPVPHDAREPTQFVFEYAAMRFGLLTDLGCITQRVVQAFADLDALLLECNHDLAMLRSGPYPPSLRDRVGGPYGHLNNAQAVDLLRRVNLHRLRHLVVGHLSEKNNSPALVLAALGQVGDAVMHRLTLLEQDCGSGWFDMYGETREHASHGVLALL